MKTKNMPASYAPAVDADAAGFEAIVAVFDNKDLGGDVIRRGAFADSINAWQASGDPIPVYWSHRLDDPNYCIGSVIEIAELAPGDKRIPAWANSWIQDHGGLWVRADLDTDGKAAQVRHLLKNRRVKQFSFSYDIVSARPGPDDTTELLQLSLYEVGPTPLGMNPLTELVGAKHADPPPEEPPAPAKRRPTSALFLRLQEIALAVADHND